MLSNGLSKDVETELFNKYCIPDNCNPEVQTIIILPFKNRDEYQAYFARFVDHHELTALPCPGEGTLHDKTIVHFQNRVRYGPCNTPPQLWRHSVKPWWNLPTLNSI